ncbi:MAG: QueT transporter family protein [Erysipelotrichaceae bacterium]|nr:QueT transporter family protein [Erysipelotrichaceae bacterium]
MKYTTKDLTNIALIAASYAVVSLVLAPISFGNIQIRIAEVLTLLPLIYKPSIYGVTLGCFLTNLIGAMMGINILGFLDIFIGTLATFLAALGTYYFKDKTIKNIPLISMIFPVLLNGIFIGTELAFVLMPNNLMLGIIIFGLEVAIGQLIAVIVGYFIINAMKKNKIFENNKVR